MGSKKPKVPKEKTRKLQPDNFFCNALAEETDRGCVLVAYAFIEFHLERLLKVHFANSAISSDDAEKAIIKREIDDTVNPDDPTALLGTGAATAKIALLTGLLNVHTYRTLQSIKKLRIKCAHHPGKVVLDDAAITELMATLDSDRRAEIETLIGNTDLKAGVLFFGPRQAAGEFSASRLRFMHACMNANGRILAKIVEIDQTTPFNGRGFKVASFQFTAPPDPT